MGKLTGFLPWEEVGDALFAAERFVAVERLQRVADVVPQAQASDDDWQIFPSTSSSIYLFFESSAM